MHTKKLAHIAILTTLALIIFFAEAQLPPPVPIPGIKLGLANIITLVALVRFGYREAFAVTVLRIVLGAVLAGTPAGLFYSLAGGLLSFLTVFTALHLLKRKHLWVVSIFGAIAHNIGQLFVAALLTETAQVFWYLPVLIMSAVITGTFTGLCAAFVLKYIK